MQTFCVRPFASAPIALWPQSPSRSALIVRGSPIMAPVERSRICITKNNRMNFTCHIACLLSQCVKAFDSNIQANSNSTIMFFSPFSKAPSKIAFTCSCRLPAASPRQNNVATRKVAITFEYLKTLGNNYIYFPNADWWHRLGESKSLWFKPGVARCCVNWCTCRYHSPPNPAI